MGSEMCIRDRVTLQALAHELGVSAERVRQIEKLAIKKMGEKLAGQDPF